MSGNPGTTHFGEYPEITNKKVERLQTGGAFEKIHRTLAPEQAARAMGSTEGDAPGKGVCDSPGLVDYWCNHDGFSGGNSVNVNMDEQKVLDSFIRHRARMEFAEDFQSISGTQGKFD